jgi:hypothetical protein
MYVQYPAVSNGENEARECTENSVGKRVSEEGKLERAKAREELRSVQEKGKCEGYFLEDECERKYASGCTASDGRGMLWDCGVTAQSGGALPRIFRSPHVRRRRKGSPARYFASSFRCASFPCRIHERLFFFTRYMFARFSSVCSS